MQYRRSGQRDGRRRRVLMDPSLTQRDAENNTSESSTGSAASRVRYGQSAHHSQQPSVTTLIPKRRFIWAVLLSLGLSLIAAVEAGYGWVYVLNPRLPSWAGLNPAAPGSLASWLSSSLLLVGAISCLLTYVLRRHRIDDYRGGYRYWLWACGAFVLGSINSSVAIHELLGEALGFSALLSGVGAWVLIGSILMFLLAPEALNSRLAAAGILLAILAYGFATAVSLGLIWTPEEPLAIMLGTSALMCGHLCLVSATGLYVRFVYLDAHDLLAVAASEDRDQPQTTGADETRAQKRAKKSAPAPAKTADTPLTRRKNNGKKRDRARSDLDEPLNGRESDKETDPPSKSKSSAAADSEPGEEDEMKSLSKSERRRLRKLKRRRAA